MVSSTFRLYPGALWSSLAAKASLTAHHDPRRCGRKRLSTFGIGILGFHHDQRVGTFVIHIGNAGRAMYSASGGQRAIETNALLCVQYLPQAEITHFTQSQTPIG